MQTQSSLRKINKITEGIAQAPRSEYSNDYAKKEKSLKMRTESTIYKLFERFTAIWGDKWARQIESNEKAVIKEWKEALADLSQNQIKQALSRARNELAWPPTIAEFIKFSKDFLESDQRMNFHHALTLAEQKVRLILKPRCYGDLELERKIIMNLSHEIYEKNDSTLDVSFCRYLERGCRSYRISGSKEIDWDCGCYGGSGSL